MKRTRVEAGLEHNLLEQENQPKRKKLTTFEMINFLEDQSEIRIKHERKKSQLIKFRVHVPLGLKMVIVFLMGSRGRKKKLSDDVVKYITNQRVLSEMAGMSLEQRCHSIMSKFNISITHTTLRRVYVTHNVKYRLPQYIYAKKGKNERQLCDTQISFSRELGQLIFEEKHLIYIDETSFHKWQRKSRSWVTPNMKLLMPNSRGSSFILIGALSSIRGLIHFKVFKGSNTSQTFYDFLIALKDKVSGNVFLVMDNLSVHKSKKVSDLFDDKFRVMYLPPYSCAMNPIERLWSMVKSQWRKRILFNVEIKEEDIIQELESIIKGLDKKKVINLVKSHLPYILRSLKGHLV